MAQPVDKALTEFTPVENLDPSIDFIQVYGDSFISGRSYLGLLSNQVLIA